jgi:hypothetical protein
LSALKHKNIRYLYQARGLNRTGFITAQWKDSIELELVGDLALEWDYFCRDLIGTGVQIQSKEDELTWTGGDNSGFLTVKNVYNALEKKTLASIRLEVGGGICGPGILP